MDDWKKLRISDEPKAGPKPVIQLPPDHVIASTRQMQKLARLLNYIDVPRRQVPEWVTNTFYAFEGYVIDEHGRDVAVDVDDFYAAFNEDEEFRWISDFLKWADVTPRQRAQRRVMPRLRYLSAAAAVYEFQYGEVDSSRRCLNPVLRFEQSELIDEIIGWQANRIEAWFFRRMNDRPAFRTGGKRRIDPQLRARSFSERAILRRYARWWMTKFFWIMPRSIIIKSML